MPLLRKKNAYSTIGTSRKKEIPPGLWTKCKGCHGVIYRSKIDNNSQVCPSCGYHYQMTAQQRIEMLVDEDSFEEVDSELESVDVINFAGSGVYEEKLRQAKEKSGMKSAIACGLGSIDGRTVALGAMDFRFMGASMGSVVGEKVARLTELSVDRRVPLVIVTASGGARMQEGLMSLMQMAKTSGGLALHNEAGLPYIVVMTHPTTAGVSASFASLGDVILAEPGALIGFAGPRVIKQTTQSELPEGFQTAEFLQRHGFIDRVVRRHDLRRELSLLMEYVWEAPAVKKKE